MSESPRPVIHRRPLWSSKRARFVALVVAIFVASASPAVAEEPDPEPAPTLPAPDPAPPAPRTPAPAPAKPAPSPRARAPVQAPRVVTPVVDTPAPVVSQAEPTTPARRTPTARKKPTVAKPEPLRHLPIRDASLLAQPTFVLAAYGGDQPEHSGIGAIGVAATAWLGLAVVLLALASLTPLLVGRATVGPFLFERRNQLALVGVNMVAAAAVCYIVVATS